MTLYTVIEAWPHTLNINMLSKMCISLPWFFNIGITLVLGTVYICVKMYWLYYIYSLAKRGIYTSSKRMADPALIGYVGAFASVDVLVCLFWTFLDPLTYTETVSESKVLPLITVSYWLDHISILLLFKCVLVVCSFFRHCLQN